ncbi:hypothetical protein PRZ48_005515 [Zasmidium cellare]|uniref:ABM domain-containing protein n=1 Tax=Zasmidium cellare TaxID=395010 RepID=A0ABR0ET85_ZASCE|nr:hypothetical protein PRZ48_005515 [Zasmidium cellare]
MYIVTSEVLLFAGKKALAGQYHDALEPHLHRIPGFVQEIRYASLDVPNKGLTLTFWDDSEAISRWRNQIDHLPIQEKGNRYVFQEYRLRIGSVFGKRQTVHEIQSQTRGFMALYWRPKDQNEQSLDFEKMSELKDEVASRVEAFMLDCATYEDNASILRLSGWGSQEDALLYEESIVRTPGDRLERRDYTRERREDAPHREPGK